MKNAKQMGRLTIAEHNKTRDWISGESGKTRDEIKAAKDEIMTKIDELGKAQGKGRGKGKGKRKGKNAAANECWPRTPNRIGRKSNATSPT